MKTELRFTVVCHCPDGASLTNFMNCFTEIVEVYNLEYLHSVDCQMICREEDCCGC